MKCDFCENQCGYEWCSTNTEIEALKNKYYKEQLETGKIFVEFEKLAEKIDEKDKYLADLELYRKTGGCY